MPVLIGLEIITVLLYAYYVRFDSPLSQERWNTLNPLFNDVHVMVFLGIAFILTFVNNYGLTSICFNFLIGSMSVQWYILGNFPTPHHTEDDDMFVISDWLYPLLVRGRRGGDGHQGDHGQLPLRRVRGRHRPGDVLHDAGQGLHTAAHHYGSLRGEEGHRSGHIIIITNLKLSLSFEFCRSSKLYTRPVALREINQFVVIRILLFF